jgi:hypothetical protein
MKFCGVARELEGDEVPAPGTGEEGDEGEGEEDRELAMDDDDSYHKTVTFIGGRELADAEPSPLAAVVADAPTGDKTVGRSPRLQSRYFVRRPCMPVTT